jgi:hypothetical protein
MLTQALQRARRAAELSGGAILVGFSGGKDALATADVLVRSGAFQRIELFAMALVQGLECFEAPIRRFAEARQLPVHFVPHWDLARLLKHAVLRPHIHGAEKLRLQKLKDVELALSHQLGIDWFAYGERADDSYARRLYTRKDDGNQHGVAPGMANLALEDRPRAGLPPLAPHPNPRAHRQRALVRRLGHHPRPTRAAAAEEGAPT